MSKGKIEVSIKDIPHIINVLEKMEKEIQFERKSKTIFIDDLYKLCEMSLKQTQEIERLNNTINEIYTKALDTSITSLDLRDYIINNLGSDK